MMARANVRQSPEIAPIHNLRTNNAAELILRKNNAQLPDTFCL